MRSSTSLDETKVPTKSGSQKSCEQTCFSLSLVNMLEEPVKNYSDRDLDYSYECCEEPNII